MDLEWYQCVLHYKVYNLLFFVVIYVVYWVFGSLIFALYVVVFYL